MGLEYQPCSDINQQAMNKTFRKTVEALEKNPTTEHNELLMEVLPSVPNKFEDFIRLQFAGWNVKLYPDGKWSFEKTGN